LERGLSSSFGTRTLVRAESGMKVVTVGTEVPIPKKLFSQKILLFVALVP